jgi:hypothetical protein
MAKRTVKLNLSGFKKLISNTKKSFESTSKNPTPVQRKWGRFILSFLQRRFNKFSRGGGNWKPLKKATIARRKKPAKGKKGGSRVAAILVDTRSVFNALKPGKKGNLFIAFKRFRRSGIRVGYNEQDKHSGGQTIHDIARYHNYGLGNLPERKIIVQPDAKTKTKIKKELKAEMIRNTKKSAIKGKGGR